MSLSLLDLPREILEIIISRLDAKSRAAIHSTSKLLHEAASALEKGTVTKFLPAIQQKFISEGFREISKNYQPERCISIGLKYADILPLDVSDQVGITSLFSHVKEVVDNTKALWAIFDSQNSLVDCRNVPEYLENIDKALTAIESPKINLHATSYNDNLLHNVRKWFVAEKIIRKAGDSYIVNQGLVEKLDKIFSKITDSGIDVNQRDNQTAAPIHYAMQCFQIDRFLDILDAHGVDVNAQTTKSSAFVGGMTSYQDNFLSLTPLHVAAMHSNINAVLKVLQLGADPAIKNSQDLTPREIAELYLRKGIGFKENLLKIEEVLADAEAQTSIGYDIWDEVLAEEISNIALNEVALLAAEGLAADLG